MIRAALLAVTATACLGSGCAHGPRPEEFRTATAPHFRVHTTLGDSAASSAARELEALHAALRQVLFPNTDLEPADVLLFVDPQERREAEAAARKDDRPRRAVKGRPLVLIDRPDIHRDRLRVSNYSTLMQQDAAVQIGRRMLDQNMRRAPPWFQQGLLAYVETMELEGDRARFGHRLPRPIAELRAGRVILLPELIGASNDKFNSGDFPRSYEASAWAFIHFLMDGDGGANRARFDVLSRTLIERESRDATASAAAIAAAFPDTTIEALGLRVRDYAMELGRLAKVKTLVVGFTPWTGTPAIVPADPEVVRGLLRAREN